MSAQDPRPLRLLVVEDSESDYELLRLSLSRAGYTVQAERVEEEEPMREALQRSAWDLVISDHSLPLFSAQAALATLQSFDRDIPFIILSGVIGEDAAVEAMHLGADDFILKDRLTRLVASIERSIKAAADRARQRAAEAALRESEERLRAIAGNLPGMLFQLHTDEEGGNPRFSYVSEAARKLFGAAPQSFMDNPALLFDLMAPEDLERFNIALAQAALARALLRWEGRARRANLPGEVLRWLQIDATPRFGEGRSIVWDGIVSDISALKQTQSELYASREELRRLGAHNARIKEEERARIAREIHDDIGGTLTGLRADLAWIKKRYSADPGMAEKIESMGGLLDSTMQASVRIARDLRPPILDFGFVAALEWQAKDFQKRTGVSCRFHSTGELEVEPDRATAVFRIFQELLTNISKHAGATEVEVDFKADAQRLRLEVTDNGVGIAEADRAKGESYGIRGMTERARELDGRLVIHRPPLGGTRVLLEMPPHGGQT